MKFIKAELKFEVRDLWVGVFWNIVVNDQLKIYICPLPCIPIILTFDRETETTCNSCDEEFDYATGVDGVCPVCYYKITGERI